MLWYVELGATLRAVIYVCVRADKTGCCAVLLCRLLERTNVPDRTAWSL
jgi:hypothetical protein